MREYPSGDGAVLIKQLPLVRFQPLVLLYSSKNTDERFVLLGMKKGVKMAKLKKIGEIRGFDRELSKGVLETLENQGFLVVDDDENDDGWKTYHILKEV